MKHWEHLHVAKSLFTVRSNILLDHLTATCSQGDIGVGGGVWQRCRVARSTFPHSTRLTTPETWSFENDTFRFRYRSMRIHYIFVTDAALPICLGPVPLPLPIASLSTSSTRENGLWQRPRWEGGGRKRRSARHLAGDYGTYRHSDETTRRIAQSYRPQCQYERDAYYEIDT